MMKNCINCGHSLELNAKFCPECGSKQPEQSEQDKKSDYSASVGDKNVISGNIIGKSEEFNISGPATINKIEDETKKFITCAVSGKHLLRGRDIVVNCPKCKSDVAQDCFNLSVGRCFNCDKTAYAQYSEKLDIVLADGVIDAMERIQLDSLALSLMIDTSKKQQLELEAKERKANANLNTIGGNSTELSGFYKIQFEKALSLVFESNDFAAATSMLSSIHSENIYHDETASLYFLVKAIHNPQQYINDYEKEEHRTVDVYWEDYWAFIPYIKTGRFDNGFKIINLNKARFSDNRNDILLSEVLAYLILFSESRESEYITEAKSLYAAFGRNIKPPLLILHEFISKLLSSDEQEWKKSSQNFHSEELFYFNYVLGGNTAGAPINSNQNEINDNSSINIAEEVSSASSNEIIVADSRQIELDENGNCWVDESLGLRARNNHLYLVDSNGLEYPTLITNRCIWLAKNFDWQNFVNDELISIEQLTRILPNGWNIPSFFDWSLLSSFIAKKNGIMINNSYLHPLDENEILIQGEVCSVGDKVKCISATNVLIEGKDYIIIDIKNNNIQLFDIENQSFVFQSASKKSLASFGPKRFLLIQKWNPGLHDVPDFYSKNDYSFVNPKYLIAKNFGLDYNKASFFTFGTNIEEEYGEFKINKNGVLVSFQDISEIFWNPFWVRLLTPLTNDLIEKLKNINFILPDYIQYSELISSQGNKLSSDINRSEEKNENKTNNKPLVDYEEVKIGNQIWMKKNLDVVTFRNGDPIPHAKSYAEWEEYGKQGKPAWCVFLENEDGYDEKFDYNVEHGKLYNWYAVNDPRGLAPEGWHVPSVAEWDKLLDNLGGPEIAGKKMKSKSGWENDGNGTNESGFSGLPCGKRFSDGYFIGLDHFSSFWSSIEAESDSNFAWQYSLGYNNSGVNEDGYEKSTGISVRCLRD